MGNCLEVKGGRKTGREEAGRGLVWMGGREGGAGGAVVMVVVVVVVVVVGVKGGDDDWVGESR